MTNRINSMPTDKLKDPKAPATGENRFPKHEAWTSLSRELELVNRSRRVHVLAFQIFHSICDEYDKAKPKGRFLKKQISLFLAGKRPKNADDGTNDKGDFDGAKDVDDDPGDADDDPPRDAGSEMDHCLRWYILLVAIQNKSGTNKNAANLVSEIITTKWPNLAFKCFKLENRGVVDELYGKKCRAKKGSGFHRIEDSSVPFLVAADQGKHEIIKMMISTLGSATANEPLLDLASLKSPSSKKTAWGLAARAENNSFDTLIELLKVPNIVTSDEPFIEAVKEGQFMAVKSFVDGKFPLKASRRSECVIDAIRRLDEPIGQDSQTSTPEDRACRLNIVRLLFQPPNDPKAFTDGVAELMVEKGLDNLWPKTEDLRPDLSEELKSCLLHLAVLHQKPVFVQRFAEDYPDSLKMQQAVPRGATLPASTDGYPLWYNNHYWDGSVNKFLPRNGHSEPHHRQPQSDQTLIHNTIVGKMMAGLGIDKISDILHQSKEPFNDLCFDISRFNSAAYKVSDFIESMIHLDKGECRRMLHYEQTLMYVELPPLDTMEADREAYKDNSYLTKEHDEVFRILRWLGEKGVKKIIKLKVPDRLINPHDALTMAEKVAEFGVEELDWKILDLPIAAFNWHKRKQEQTPEQPPQQELRHLHLYSSGNWAVIDHWLNSAAGVESLDKLDKLRIHIVRETCAERRAKSLISDILTDQQSMVSRYKQRYDRRITAYVPVEVSWYPVPSPPDLKEIADRLSTTLGAWLPELNKVVKERQKAKGILKHEPTKVAILDNGILSISPVASDAQARGRTTAEHRGSDVTANPAGANPSSPGQPGEKQADNDKKSLWTHIETGRSFVDSSSRSSPWQFPSDPHGTQMANLICAIDPSCKLYVARVAEDAFGITAERVAKAIKWAREEGVDVISMSFVIGEDSKEMQDQIRLAANAGIVMTCTVHDEGSRIAEAYPMHHKGLTSGNLLVLAACDKQGRLLRDVKNDDYDYRLCGNKVHAGSVPFIKGEEVITGSSVATALAAGLCSLIITCDRLAHPGRTYIEHPLTNPTYPLPRERKEKPARMDVVKEHLNYMQNSRHVDLDKFGKLGGETLGLDNSTVVVEDGESPAEKVLVEQFGMKKEYIKSLSEPEESQPNNPPPSLPSRMEKMAAVVLEDLMIKNSGPSAGRIAERLSSKAR